MKAKINTYGIALIAAAILFLAYLMFHSSNNLYNYKPANTVICPTKKTCLDKKNACKCWCSHKCGPRDKEKDDNPLWIESDPYGNFCYCKQWDLDNIGRCLVKPKGE